MPRASLGALRAFAPSLAALALPVAALALSLGTGGCADECCTVDSEPIPVGRAPLGTGAGAGGLIARAQLPGAVTPFDMVVDTGSPVTILAGPAPQGTIEIQQGGFDLLDSSTPATAPPRVRARFRNLGLFSLPLGPVGDATEVPQGVLGGDLLHAFSVEFRFAKPCADDGDAGAADAGAPGAGCSSVTFWRHQGASLGFLEDAGYAVVRFQPYGGGETTAQSQPDFLGLQGPVTLPATRVVLRTCAVPRVFSRTEPREACCARGDEITPPRATGVDLSLLLATGVGPMVLSQSAFARVAAQLAAQAAPTPALTAAPLLVATWPTPIAAEWTTLPRLAVVDGFEPPSTGDEGPCVDLGRARRIEWAVAQQTPPAGSTSIHADVAACVQPCDTDPSETSEDLSSAAYIQIGGAIPVAVVDDAEPFLQSLRADIRPEGPDIDGLVGAAALGAARLEVDYLADTPRVIFSCEVGAPPDACYTASRCPRLPDQSSAHLCFGLPLRGLPTTCAPSGCP